MKQSSFFYVDLWLILPVVVLVMLSLTTLFSINIAFFRNQLIFFIIGSLLFLFFSQIQYQLLQIYAKPIYIISLIIFILLLLIGFESRGAVRWVSFFGVAVQFSEVLKPFLIIVLAEFLTKKPSLSFQKFCSILLLLIPIAFLLYRQPDLGNAIIYVVTTVLILFFYGFPWWWFGVGLLSFLASIPITWRFLHTYQKERLLTFFHITNDPLKTSYNAIQSVITVGSGEFLGKGLGQGTQSALRFLPERQTDFLFATLSEMLGFVGAFVVVAAFVVLFYRLFVLIQRADNTFSKVFIFGAFSILCIQFFMNIGMNIGIVPIVGVTLPFVSYGGSSFIANAILLGLVSAMSKNSRVKQVMEIR